jgi:hypothetical protein
MRYRGLSLAVVAALLWPTSALPQDKPELEVLQSVRRGEERTVHAMEVASHVARTSLGEVPFHSLRIAPGQHGFRLALPRLAESGGSSLSRFRFDENALAAFPGGFLETYSPATPAGLVLQGKKILNELRPQDPVMKAVVCYSADARAPIVIWDASAFSTDKATGDCVQTGPFLVKEGRNEADLAALDAELKFPFAVKPFDRAFLALDLQDHIVVGVARRISLFAMRAALLKSREEGGFGARLATALTGTRTAGLIVADEGGGEITAGNIKTLLPNAVVVERRPQ